MALLAASNIGEALVNTVVGLVTVFAILIFLIFVISLFRYVNEWQLGREEVERRKAEEEAEKARASAPRPVMPKAPAAPAAAAPAVPSGPGTMENSVVSIADEVEGPVAAVILAAVAETCGGSFKVTSIRKSKD